MRLEGTLDYIGRRHRPDYVPCRGHARHWFTRGVGEVTPKCVRCGHPNPKWKTLNAAGVAE